MTLRGPTSAPPDSRSSERVIREFLVKAGEVYGKRITSALTAVWIEQLGHVKRDQLLFLFRLVLAKCKFFPTPADVLEPVAEAQNAGVPLAAELKWLEVKRYADSTSPDIPAKPIRIKEQTQAAINAAGGLDWIRDCATDELQWAKKRFVEAWENWTIAEKNQFVLPEGEVKNLITESAKKLLPQETRKKILGAKVQEGR